MEFVELDNTILHFRSYFSLEEYREANEILAMIRTTWETDHSQVSDPETHQIHFIVSFMKKMEEKIVISDEPDKEVFLDFKCTGADYAATYKCFERAASLFSQHSLEEDIIADKAILTALFIKHLKEGLIFPDIEILKEIDDAIFLRDTGKGKTTIAEEPEFVCQYYGEVGDVFFVDADGQWREIVHRALVFQRFAPIEDKRILKIIAKLPPRE